MIGDVRSSFASTRMNSKGWRAIKALAQRLVFQRQNRNGPSGMNLNPHSHTFEQMAYIVSGRAIYHVGDVGHQVGAGSFLLFLPAWCIILSHRALSRS